MRVTCTNRNISHKRMRQLFESLIGTVGTYGSMIWYETGTAHVNRIKIYFIRRIYGMNEYSTGALTDMIMPGRHVALAVNN